MVRVKKIECLIQKGVPIKYHFGIYRSQRRLIIDQVEDLVYTNTVEDQKLAREYLDLIFWEWMYK